jgi:hypothetical protein
MVSVVVHFEVLLRGLGWIFNLLFENRGATLLHLLL